MAVRRPLVVSSGTTTEMPAGDIIHGDALRLDALVDAGEEVFSRRIAVGATVSSSSGTFLASCFTARKSETTTGVRVLTGTTAAAATPTLCQVGLYTLDPATGDGTLVAQTANDTTLFAAASTAYTRAWEASHAKVAGARYAVGTLVVSSFATPTFVGQAFGTAITVEAAVPPRLNGRLSGRTSLPATFTEAGLFTSGSIIYGVILP